MIKVLVVNIFYSNKHKAYEWLSRAVLWPRTKVSFTKPQLRFGLVNETFVFGHKTSYWAIAL